MVGVLVLIAWNLILVYISSNVPCFGRPLPIWIQTMRREFFRWVFGSFLLFVLILLLLSAVWCLFAALLHPSEFLPWTAAIVTFFAEACFAIAVRSDRIFASLRRHASRNASDHAKQSYTRLDH